MTKTLMAGMDLHSNNVMIGIMDQEGRRLKHQKLPCDFKAVDGFLKPFKSRLKSVAVESTFNWHWLVDGLRQSGYPAVLANPAGISDNTAESSMPTTSMTLTFWPSCSV